MTLFTQGSWTLDKRNGHIKADGKTIADVFGATVHNHSDNAAEAMANARLIVAAPDMYRLLLSFVYPAEYDNFVTSVLRTNAEKLLARIEEVNNA